MGNCLLTSKFNIEVQDLLKPYIKSNGLYELCFKFKDLYLNPVIDFSETSYSIIFLFSKYRFINTYIYKNSYHNGNMYKEKIENIGDIMYFRQKITQFNGYYHNETSISILPTVELLKKINNNILTQMYDTLIY